MTVYSELLYDFLLDELKFDAVLGDSNTLFQYKTYAYPKPPKLITTHDVLGGVEILRAKFVYKSKEEFDYENYLYNITNTIRCPVIERAFSDHLDDVDPDILYHVMQSYRENAIQSQFGPPPDQPWDYDGKFWDYNKIVKVPDKLIEVGDFYGTTERLKYLWDDCWDI